MRGERLAAEIFDAADEQGDAVLSPGELQSFLNGPSRMAQAVRPLAWDTLFRYLDEDAILDKEEWAAAWVLCTETGHIGRAGVPSTTHATRTMPLGKGDGERKLKVRRGTERGEVL